MDEGGVGWNVELGRVAELVGGESQERRVGGGEVWRGGGDFEES